MKINKKTGLPYLFMLPSILILLGVYLLPFLYSLYISVTDWSGMGQKLNFVGLSNYKGLFEEPHFWETLRNNLIYFVELVGIQFIISMVLAVVLMVIGGILSLVIPLLPAIGLVILIMWFVRGSSGPGGK